MPKRKVGRPKIGLKNLPKGWKKTIIEAGTIGKGKIEFAVALGIGKSTLYKLLVDEPEFTETINVALEKSECWWREKGRKNIENKSFNSVLWYMNMKNRWHWSDKQEIGQPGSFSKQAIEEGKKLSNKQLKAFIAKEIK